MPQGETFWNPYRMVPVREEIKRRKPATHERFTGRSGVLSCSLENLTLLFVGGDQDYKEQFLKRDGRCVIPGSSLKGAIRSLAEAAGGGCYVIPPKGVNLPKNGHNPCDKAHALCITCRMFGMMERSKNARVHMGQVSFGDALMKEGEAPRTDSFEVVLMNHGARHRSFYENPLTGKLDGLCRKFYFHQPRTRETVPPIPDKVRASMNEIARIQALLPGHHFSFEVQFSNLEKDELALLLYALSLEEEVEVQAGDQKLTGPLRHRFGMGKPLGMGTCRVVVDRLVLLQDPKARFSTLQPPQPKILEGTSLKDEIEELTRAYREDRSPAMEHLRKLLVWDESDPRAFEYPSYSWFKNTENSGKPLKRI